MKESFVVMYDFPSAAKNNLSSFYRRLRELLADQGGTAECRATKSAYIVSGAGARILAYAIGALASAHGAGKVGEQDGVIVLPLGDLPPSEHFAALKQADEIVSKLTVDRRTRANKKQPRDITVLAAQADHSKKNTLGETEGDDADAFLVDLTQVLKRARAEVEA